VGSGTRFADLVATAAAVAATSKRGEKIALLAGALRHLAPDEIAPAVGFLSGALRQGRIGVGWAAVSSGAGAAPASEPELTVGEVDRVLGGIADASGAGSASERAERLAALLARATAPETEFLARLLVGELRQGALAGVMTQAVADAARVPPALLRRAAMLGGDLPETARIALRDGERGLRAVALEVGRPVQPMLAASSPDVAAALAATGPASVEWKLDGARVQVHRRGADVRIFTRTGNEVTGRLPELLAIVRSFPVATAVLDGEVLGVDEQGAPRPFQDTMSRFGSGTAAPEKGVLRPYFFDVLYADGELWIDRPLGERRERLAELVGEHRVPGVATEDPGEAAALLEDALAAGHEGVMVKDLASPYEAGRRGRPWRKVKPVRTLDLVVLAAEWGHGRRRGLLSNLHLGARDPETGGFMMVGKTFKGLSDELLRWQTQELRARAVSESAGAVRVRPELVVEIALDGVQRSRRYPGGVALRFARVRGYRPDRDPALANTIADVRALLERER